MYVNIKILLFLLLSLEHCVFGSSDYDSQCPRGQMLRVDGLCVEPLVNQNIYLFEFPHPSKSGSVFRGQNIRDNYVVNRPSVTNMDSPSFTTSILPVTSSAFHRSPLFQHNFNPVFETIHQDKGIKQRFVRKLTSLPLLPFEIRGEQHLNRFRGVAPMSYSFPTIYRSAAEVVKGDAKQRRHQEPTLRNSVSLQGHKRVAPSHPIRNHRKLAIKITPGINTLRAKSDTRDTIEWMNYVINYLNDIDETNTSFH